MPLEIVKNKALLDSFLDDRHIYDYFSTCSPRFFLLHYRQGELLTTPFTPSQYLQFMIEGDLLLYEMPNENSTVSLQTSHNDIRMIGDMELLDVDFVPFFVEARTDVYTAAFYLEQYRSSLLQDPVFLRLVCRSLAGKLRGATDVSLHIGLKNRLAAYIDRKGVGYEIKGVSSLSEQLNVSERQMIRVLKRFCEDGVLKKEKAGHYRILCCPGNRAQASEHK